MMLKAFLFSGTICMIAQIILDNTKLTPGHITALFTVFGSFLSFLGIYDKLITYFGAGATVLISNFGHLLYTSGLLGLKKEGLFGIFSYLLNNSSLALVSVLVFSTIFAILFNPKS